MQIVIEMSEEDYKGLQRKDKFDDMCLGYCEKLIVHGTPLPKGHGRLIDADALGEKLNRYTEAPYQYALAVFNEAPTIIKADKEE